MAEDNDVLKSNVIQGFGTLIAREAFLKVLSFIGQIFLARLLAPSEFGVYVIIVFVVNFLSYFSDIGLSLAIIQKHKEPTKEELSSVFFLKMALSCLIVILIWIFAPFLRNFYPAFSASNVLMTRMLSLIIITGSIRSIPISLLERKIKYNLISLIDIYGVSIYYVITLAFALMHFGAWSFILGALAKEIGETIVLYIIQPFFPSLTYSRHNVKGMIKFGIYIQGNSLVNFLGSSITPLLGGRAFGTAKVGLLDFAYNIASVPELVGVNFGRVAFAGYSRIQEQKELLLKSIRKSMSMLAILLYIFPVVILCFGNQLVPLFFSNKWIPAVPALYWYSLEVFILPIIIALGQVILAIGKSKEIFWVTFITAVVGWIGVFFLVHIFGFTGIAIIYTLTTLLLSIFYLFILVKSGFNFSPFSILGPKMVVAILTIVFSLILNTVFNQSFIMLVVKLVISAGLYLSLMLLFAKNDTVELFLIVINFVKQKRI
jgi:PST family polysaccharide transporter